MHGCQKSTPYERGVGVIRLPKIGPWSVLFGLKCVDFGDWQFPDVSRQYFLGHAVPLYTPYIYPSCNMSASVACS